MNSAHSAEAAHSGERLVDKPRETTGETGAFIFRPGSHIETLDGVRGLAALLVMLHHFAPFPGEAAELQPFTPLLHVLHTGWVGVDLFFVLSGFLITGILWDCRSLPNMFRTFYMRRVLRIFPLYYGVLIAVFWVLPGLTYLVLHRSLDGVVAHFRHLRSIQGWLWLYGANIATSLYGPCLGYFGHFWSLAVEEHFYVVWPLLVSRLSLRRLWLVCSVMVAAAPITRLVLGHLWGAWAGYTFTACRWDGLAIGSALALWVRQPGGLANATRLAARVCAPLCVALVVVYALTGLDPTDPSCYVAGLSIIALLAGSLVTLAAGSMKGSMLYRFFGGRLLCWLGRYSYGIYVFHYFLVPVLALYFPFPKILAHTPTVGVAVAAKIALGVLPACVIAFASWHIFERPFLNLKRYFAFDSGTTELKSASVPL